MELIAKHQQFHLEKLAQDFERSQRIRIFISTLMEKSQDLPEIKEWLRWATNYAENLDPVNEPESILAMHSQINELNKYQLNSLKW